jgi:hypothetical protein
VVECFLAKEDVAGSNPVSRSNKASSFLDMLAFRTVSSSFPFVYTRGAVPKW